MDAVTDRYIYAKDGEEYVIVDTNAECDVTDYGSGKNRQITGVSVTIARTPDSFVARKICERFNLYPHDAQAQVALGR